MFTRETSEFAEVHSEAMHDLALLSNDVLALDGVMADATSDPLARADYRAAVGNFQLASQALDQADTVTDLQQVSEAIDEAQYSMLRVHARLDGKPLPDRRPACFFDPSHGPSLSEVAWEMPGGAVRKVPACGACAVAVLQRAAPGYREVTSGGQRVPHWEAGDHHGPYRRGFGNGGSLLSGVAGMAAGLLLGDVLGGDGWDSG